MANFTLDRYNVSNTSPSWLASWAGIIATLDTSAFLAIILIYVTRRYQPSEEIAVAPGGLGQRAEDGHPLGPAAVRVQGPPGDGCLALGVGGQGQGMGALDPQGLVNPGSLGLSS